MVRVRELLSTEEEERRIDDVLLLRMDVLPEVLSVLLLNEVEFDVDGRPERLLYRRTLPLLFTAPSLLNVFEELELL